MIWLVGTLGLAIGFLAGIAVDDALDLWLAARRDRAHRHTKESTVRRPTFNSLLRAALPVVLVANLLLGVLLIQQRAASQDFTECVATWQRDFGRVYDARADAAAEVQVKLDGIVRSVDRGAGVSQGVDQYLAVRREQDRKRERNPIPEQPTELCGRPRP